MMVEERVEEGQTAKKRKKSLAEMDGLGQAPNPQLRLHGVDSQATPVPCPAGLVHLRVVGFLVVFPERGASMASACTVTALSLHSRTMVARSSFSAALYHP